MTKIITSVPLLGFAAYSGTGKTTLLESMLPILVGRGIRVAVIKHAHHDFDIDKPGKDSYRLRKAGANQMLISSRYRLALIIETPEQEATLPALIAKLDQNNLDLILVEGFKHLDFPKMELYRARLGKPWLHPQDRNIIAIACDTNSDTSLPRLDLNNLEQISDFIADYARPIKKTQSMSCFDSSTAQMLPVKQARHRILEQVSPLKTSLTVTLKQAMGHILARDIVSSINVPQHTNSAMDGFAVRGDDLSCQQYQLVTTITAGQSYGSALEKGQTVKIMTGAPVPENADTVVMREQAVENQGLVRFDTEKTGIQAGQNVRQAGEDLAIGQVAFYAGCQINTPELGMLASMGIAEVEIMRPVKVAIFSTGDEVQNPNEAQTANCVFDSNRYSLFSLLSRLGCEVLDLGIIEDNEASLAATLTQASHEADLVLSSGGVSVGDADHVKSVLDRIGEIDFWRINMRPGRPLAFGMIENTPFFGLPGNPVAVIVSFLQFVEPAIRKLQGNKNWSPQELGAIASERIRSRLGRTEYTRGVYTLDANGRVNVRSTGTQGAGVLRSMSQANCLIEVAPEQASVDIGELVKIIPLSGRL